jgi:outer membrane protein assembly factor BamD
LRYLLLILTSFFLFYCSGNKPTPEWTARDYYKAAKEEYDDESFFEAANDFTVVLLRFAGSTVADSAQYYLADSHYEMGDYLIAAVEFEKLINDMNRSPLVADAQLRLAQCYYELSPRAALDQEYTIKAIREYQYFVEENPTHPKKEQAEKRIFKLRNKLGEKEYENAEIYRKMKEFEAAVIYYDQVLAKYYDTDWADDSQYGKIRALIEAEDVSQAQLEIAKFEQQFPDSEFLQNVKELKTKLTQVEEEIAHE